MGLLLKNSREIALLLKLIQDIEQHSQQKLRREEVSQEAHPISLPERLHRRKPEN